MTHFPQGESGDKLFITLPFPILKSRDKSPSGDIKYITLVVVSDLTLAQSQVTTLG